MKHNFAQVPEANIPRSKFNRSHGIKTTFNAGKLVPIYVDEALPGDTFNLDLKTFARLQNPVVPIMDNIFIDTFFFAVPMRLVWSNFEKFMGAQDDPGDSIDYTIPTADAPASTGYTVETLQDYIGLPTGIPDYTHSNLWCRAYNLIWNEWFRDQNLQNSVTVDTGDGPDTVANYVLLDRGKRHDYFTSCLPWPQKGDAIELPLGTKAPVMGIGSVNQTFNHTSGTAYETGASSSTTYANYKKCEDTGAIIVEQDPDNTGYPNIWTDLGSATAATVNEVRQAFQLQKLLERDARSGTRYVEINLAHFGVETLDQRVQRPEYLGGSTARVNVHPVPQTSSTDATTPQGNLAAFATAAHDGHGFVKSFTEHCLVIGLINARADLTYQQGLDRMFSRSTRYDFYWPALAQIGEQTVLNKEIYMQDPATVDGNGDAYNELVFGYQERHAEYRFKKSMITGKFRSTYATSLDSWHLSQEFSSLPTLGDTFIKENPPIDRVIAVTDESDFFLDAYINLSCARPMPAYGVPGMIDHF